MSESNGSVSAAPAALWLSCHVDYQCQHSGACCRSGWPLPVETGVLAEIDGAVAGGRLATVDGSPVWFLASIVAPDGMAGTLRQVDGGCVFHRPAGVSAADGNTTRHCAVHATLGHAALPASCQHFPRVCLVDDRGVRVALSHSCPTAASLLIDHAGPVSIVAGPWPVPGVAVPEGLDVRGELPPRLSPRVLADWPGFSAWEAHVVDVLAGPGAAGETTEAALTILADDANRLAAWRPGGETLSDAVARLHDPSGRRRHAGAAPTPALSMAGVHFAAARAACRPPWTWRNVPTDLEALDLRFVSHAWPAVAPILRRYLAAKAFAAWVTYQVDATLALVAWLRLALAVVRIECVRACEATQRPLDRGSVRDAIRQADLLLVHYADGAHLQSVAAAE